jgi:hypothetical protein
MDKQLHKGKKISSFVIASDHRSRGNPAFSCQLPSGSPRSFAARDNDPIEFST